MKVILLSYLSEESFPEKLSIAKLQAPICNIIWVVQKNIFTMKKLNVDLVN